jgi:hypothetical protein
MEGKMKTEIIEKREVEDGRWKARRRKGRKRGGNIWGRIGSERSGRKEVKRVTKKESWKTELGLKGDEEAKAERWN